jgi:hypothetical protein
LAAIRLSRPLPLSSLPGGVLRVSRIPRQTRVSIAADYSFVGILPALDTHRIFVSVCRHEPTLQVKNKPTSPLNEIRLASCQAEGGMSGSPVLNGQGEITAIVSFKGIGLLQNQPVPSVVATLVPENFVQP